MRAAVLLIAVLALPGCYREGADASRNTPSETTTVAGDTTTEQSKLNPPIASEKEEPASRPTAAPPAQEVHLIEYAIHMQPTARAGTVSFVVENGGKEEHAFEIEGNGIEEKTDTLMRGNTTTLTVNLRPGTYTVYCPVKDHAKKGMKTTLTVQ